LAQKTTGSAGIGDNSDPAVRAQQTRDALDGLDQCEVDLAEARDKIKKRADKHRSVLKALGHKMADLAFPRRLRALKRQIEDAENPKDRASAQDRFDAALASAIEGVAAVDEEGQLDFNDILERGEKARAKGDGKTTTLSTGSKAKH